MCGVLDHPPSNVIESGDGCRTRLTEAVAVLLELLYLRAKHARPAAPVCVGA